MSATATCGRIQQSGCTSLRAAERGAAGRAGGSLGRKGDHRREAILAPRGPGCPALRHPRPHARHHGSPPTRPARHHPSFIPRPPRPGQHDAAVMLAPRYHHSDAIVGASRPPAAGADGRWQEDEQGRRESGGWAMGAQVLCADRGEVRRGSCESPSLRLVNQRARLVRRGLGWRGGRCVRAGTKEGMRAPYCLPTATTDTLIVDSHAAWPLTRLASAHVTFDALWRVV